MRKLIKSILLASCVITSISTQAAEAQTALVGNWELTSMTLAGQSISCPGELPLPPSVPGVIKQYAKCNAGEFIQLTKRKSRGVYFENLTNIASTSPNGTWTAVNEKQVAASFGFPAIPAVNYIVFDDSDNASDPQAYSYVLSRDRKTLTIRKAVGSQGMRFPADLIFTKRN